jgi:hypothetical protein
MADTYFCPQNTVIGHLNHPAVTHVFDQLAIPGVRQPLNHQLTHRRKGHAPVVVIHRSSKSLPQNYFGA